MSEKIYAGPVRIGSVQIPNRVFFAPMAGVSDLPFRLLCHEQGAGLVCMEMISAKAIVYGNRRTRELWETDPAEAPVSLQLFGHEPEVFAEACRIIENETFDLLDINMGCPVPKVTGNQEGSALMKKPELIEEIVRACKENTSRPVTVKLRRGFEEGSDNAVECALAAQEGGASAVAVHGRTRAQMYSGKADWGCIASVKQALSVPVIGNGDVTGADSAVRMMEETGCDAVMVARAAQGNPWIFREIAARFEGKPVPVRPSRREVVRMLLRHADMLCRLKGETIGIRQMRGHASWYLSGFPGAAKVRGRINKVNSLAELEQLMAKEYPYA